MGWGTDRESTSIPLPRFARKTASKWLNFNPLSAPAPAQGLGLGPALVLRPELELKPELLDVELKPLPGGGGNSVFVCGSSDGDGSRQARALSVTSDAW